MQHLFFQRCIVLIPDRQIHPRLFVYDAPVMAEGFKACFAVIAAHAALADTAEGHRTGGEMDDRVVDTAAAEPTADH